MGRDRLLADWSTSAFWAALASAIGDRVSDRIQVWKRDQQGRWTTGEKSDLAENQTGLTRPFVERVSHLVVVRLLMA